MIDADGLEALGEALADSPNPAVIAEVGLTLQRLARQWSKTMGSGITVDQLQCILEAAKAATTGPWYARGRHLSRIPDTNVVGGTLPTDSIANFAERDDCAFAAACDPSTIAAIVEELMQFRSREEFASLKQARADCAQWRAVGDDLRVQLSACQEDLRAANAERNELRSDLLSVQRTDIEKLHACFVERDQLRAERDMLAKIVKVLEYDHLSDAGHEVTLRKYRDAIDGGPLISEQWAALLADAVTDIETLLAGRAVAYDRGRLDEQSAIVAIATESRDRLYAVADRGGSMYCSAQADAIDALIEDIARLP